MCHKDSVKFFWHATNVLWFGVTKIAKFSRGLREQICTTYVWKSMTKIQKMLLGYEEYNQK